MVSSLTLLSMLFLTTLEITGSVSGTSTNSQGCSNLQQFSILASKVNESQAKSTASSALNANVGSGEYGAFQTSYLMWAFDPGTCTNITLTSVNVVYGIHVNGSLHATQELTIEINPQLTKVLGTDLRPLQSNFSVPNTYSPSYGGYAFWAASNPVFLYESIIWWNVPDVAVPSGYNCSTTCEWAFWTGIYNTGTSQTPQGGTDSQITCNYHGCTRNYYAWYQFIGVSGPQTCYSVSTGDQIGADANTQAIVPGGSVTTYFVTVADTTKGLSCTGQATLDQLTNPNRAFFTGERPQHGCPFGCYYAPIAHFSAFSPFNGGMYTSPSTVVNLQTPYSNGYGDVSLIQPSGCPSDVSTGAVSASDVFTQSWNSSCGTY